ncbi:MAG: hypothetical protein WBM98_18745 [Maribacter sp.]|uniref:hypothetical protein n=1 Tax=Maribacter sp. TaxID=1897614 RepID=UPI003C776B96
MKTLKRFLGLTALFLLTTAFVWDCEDDPIEYTCEDCVKAQVELCNALGASNCKDTSAVDAAEAKVRERCDGGASKVALINDQCYYNENVNCLGFSCY